MYSCGFAGFAMSGQVKTSWSSFHWVTGHWMRPLLGRCVNRLSSPVRVIVLPVIFTRLPTVSGSALILSLSVSFYNAVSAVMYLILKCPSATSPTPLFGC